jgi:hypothetical protein
MWRRVAEAVRKLSVLDLLHKAVFPALALGLGVVVFVSNRDKQNQIDRLQVSVQVGREEQSAVKEQLTSYERDQEDRLRQAEDRAQGLRVELCKELYIAPDMHPRAYNALGYIGFWQTEDVKRLGPKKAKELWEKANKQAEEESKAKKLDPNNWG